MKIKICGIKTLDDALIAIDAGAEMLGFNFYPSSPRYIEPERCTRLVAVLRETAPHITTVGVFVNTPPGEVDAILTTCGLDLAQLCGDEPPEALVALNGRAFKALRPQGDGMQEDAGAPDATVEALLQAGRYARRTPPALLVDAASPGAQYGGSGRVADWRIAAALAAEMPVLLAGGLHSDNVAAAIAAVQPWGVDVASGVESAPGVKDPAKVRAFIRSARQGREAR